MEKINQEIVDSLYELFIVKLREMGELFYHQLKDIEWSADQKNGLQKLDISRNFLDDFYDTTKNKIYKKCLEFEKFKEKESEHERSVVLPGSPKRRAPAEVRE